MQAGREWACWNKYFDTKERSCYNLVFAVYSIVFYRVLNLHERQLYWNTDLIVLFGARSKPAILSPIFEHDKIHGLKTQRLVNNIKPSCRCIAPFPAIIQPDKCHVSHHKQCEIRRSITLNSGHNTVQNTARQMFRSTTVAGQIWCLALSRSTRAAKMTLWPDSSWILALSGYKFCSGDVSLSKLTVRINHLIEPSTWGCKQVNSFIKQLIVSYERKQS